LSHQENFPNGLKLDPSESVFDPLRMIKRKERFNVWRTCEDFPGFDLRLRFIPLVLCRRLWDTYDPDLCHFWMFLYNFVYNVKAYIRLSGKHTSWTLANMVSTFFNIFEHFGGFDGLFLPGHIIILQIFIFLS